jgi:hypothetical protein
MRVMRSGSDIDRSEASVATRFVAASSIATRCAFWIGVSFFSERPVHPALVVTTVVQQQSIHKMIFLMASSLTGG